MMSRRRICTVLVLAVILALVAASRTPVMAANRGPFITADRAPVATQETDAPDVVVFLLGDSGKAKKPVDPTLRSLQEDVRVARTTYPESEVAVAFLGDNVYENGIPDESNSGYAEASGGVCSICRMVRETVTSFSTWFWRETRSAQWCPAKPCLTGRRRCVPRRTIDLFSICIVRGRN